MSLKTLLHELGRGLRHHRATFSMAIAVQAICLLLFTIFVVITLNMFGFLSSARNRVDIYAFVSDEAKPDDLKQSLKEIAGVADVRYVTKDEALSELKQDLGESSSVIDALGYNPLPPSLRIRLAPGYASARNLVEVERKISIMPGIKELWSGRELLARLERIFTTAVIVDLALLIVIALSVVFIIFQSVESTIYTRQKEIEIMRLVGATNAAVKGPFYFEGVFQGVAGGAVAFALALALYQVAATQLPQPIFPIPGLAILDVVLGGVLGYLGADIALSRLVK
jgi:cell division transport system permease protein